MQRGQTAMFAREIIYTPYFYLQKRNHVGFINEWSSNTRLFLIDRMTKHNNLVMLWIECIYNQWQYIIELNLKRYFKVLFCFSRNWQKYCIQLYCNVYHVCSVIYYARYLNWVIRAVALGHLWLFLEHSHQHKLWSVIQNTGNGSFIIQQVH